MDDEEICCECTVAAKMKFKEKMYHYSNGVVVIPFVLAVQTYCCPQCKNEWISKNSEDLLNNKTVEIIEGLKQKAA